MFSNEKNRSFNKNETESKVENCMHSFRKINHVLQFVWELQIMSDELEVAKEKREYFLEHLFCPRAILLTFLLYINQCIKYWINFQLLAFKIFESLTVSLNSLYRRRILWQLS